MKGLNVYNHVLFLSWQSVTGDGRLGIPPPWIFGWENLLLVGFAWHGRGLALPREEGSQMKDEY